ncbi:MAG: VOC family protein [Bdellovibrionales bacterium]|nr:VOC family protein [Bdellovibrionales bacterium]
MNPLKELRKYIGSYKGDGINHEQQPFSGYLCLSELFDSKGMELEFKAIGKDGTIYHAEKSVIAPGIDENLYLWNLNTNSNGMIPHLLKSTQPRNGSQSTFLFGFNNIENQDAFREEIAIDLWSNGEISYSYSWGLPGGNFEERSGAKMKRSTVDRINHVIAMVEDMNRSVEFYRDTVGLNLKFQSDNWTEFEAGSVIFALHGGGQKPKDGRDLNDPHSSVAGTASISFDVPDVNVVYEKLSGQGVPFTLKPTARENESILLAVATDPDGFELCFAQRLS